MQTLMFHSTVDPAFSGPGVVGIRDREAAHSLKSCSPAA